MAKRILVDEIHVSIFVSKSVTVSEAKAIRRSLSRPRLALQMRRVVRDQLRTISGPGKVYTTISR